AGIVHVAKVLDEALREVLVALLIAVRRAPDRAGVVGVVPDQGVVRIGLHDTTLDRRLSVLLRDARRRLRAPHGRTQQQRVPEPPPLLEVTGVERVVRGRYRGG